MTNSAMTDEELDRYARHIVLRQVGGAGQQRMKAARIAVVGAGGIGSAVIPALAGAGVGRLSIIDGDTVDLSNLQRQPLYRSDQIGQGKALLVAQFVNALNRFVEVVPIACRVDATNAAELLANHDLILDGTDNFPTRFLLADACHLARRTLVSAAVLRFDGQLSTFRPGGPCYRCLYPAPPPPGLVPTCSEAGILGAVTGVMGALMATEVLKEIMGIGDTMAGRVLIWDALAARVRTIALPRDPACALCGDHPSITDLGIHA